MDVVVRRFIDISSFTFIIESYSYSRIPSQHGIHSRIYAQIYGIGAHFFYQLLRT